MYVCMCALQLNELSALRNTVYPEYKYVCMYVCLLLSIIGIFGYHLGFYFLFIIGIICIIGWLFAWGLRLWCSGFIPLQTCQGKFNFLLCHTGKAFEFLGDGSKEHPPPEVRPTLIFCNLWIHVSEISSNKNIINRWTPLQ